MARDFKAWLSSRNLKQEGKGLARELFNRAVEEGLISQNPFRRAAVGAVTVRANKERQHYIPLDTFAKVLAVAPNAHWRAKLVLARIGGLRSPSELAALRWRDVDFTKKQILVHASKTEHHEGHETRIVPMFPDIERELLKIKGEREKKVFPAVLPETNLRTGLERILRRAKVKQWPKLWQNLRASAATDMARIALQVCRHHGQCGGPAGRRKRVCPT